MLNTPRALKSFLILAPHPKSLRQIGEPLVFRTNFGSVGIALLRSNGRKRRQPLQWKCASHPPSLFIQNHSPNREPLVFRNELRKHVRTSHGRFVYCGNGEGDRSIGGPIFVRGIAPSMAGTPRALFIQNHYAKSGSPWFFGTNSGSVYEPFMGGCFFIENGEGDRSIGKANLRKGHSPFNGRHASCPLYWKLALYRLLLLAQKKLYKTFEWDSILTQFSFSRQPSNKTRHVRYRTKSKRDNRKPAQCQ